MFIPEEVRFTTQVIIRNKGYVNLEEKVYESLEGISQLLKIGSFSFETCQGFINEAIFEYWKYKTDFEDILMELFFDSNKFDEILEFLIKS